MHAENLGYTPTFVDHTLILHYTKCVCVAMIIIIEYNYIII